MIRWSCNKLANTPRYASPFSDTGAGTTAPITTKGKVSLHCTVWCVAVPPSMASRCPACGGTYSPHLPGQPEEWMAWHTTCELLVRGSAAELNGLPLPTPLWASLVRCPHQTAILHCPSGRLRANLPSLPWVADQVVLCGWRTVDYGPFSTWQRAGPKTAATTASFVQRQWATTWGSRWTS